MSIKTISLLLLIALGTLCANAQNGSIYGKVVDEKKEGVFLSNVSILDTNGKVVQEAGTTTDFDGFYKLKSLKPGAYTFRFGYPGYFSQTKSGVIISAGKQTTLNISLVLNPGYSPQIDTSKEAMDSVKKLIKILQQHWWQVVNLNINHLKQVFPPIQRLAYVGIIGIG